MLKKILFVLKKENTGGVAYEKQIKEILEKKSQLDTLELDSKKNNIFFFTKLKYSYQIRSFNSAKKYDTLITNKAGVYAGILKKRVPEKILIFHHYFAEENKYPLVRLFLKNRLLSNLKKFDKVIVVSAYWKNFIAQYTDVNKIHIIYNSFDTAKINSIKQSADKNAFRIKYNIPGDKIIVYAGSAQKIKGYKEVISLLDAKKYFVITSGSNDKDAEISHLHLSLDYEGYIQLLCSVDITVILSRFHEGWNRIAHESLLCGTRVIGTGIAGFGELLNNAGQFIYNNGDNLQELISNSLRDNSLIEKGINYTSQFNLDYLEKMTDIFLS